MTARHATANIETAKDFAPEYGYDEMGEARFLRDALGAERIGMAHYRMKPDRRIGFGHRHGESEEIYVVVSGSGRFKIEDEIIDVGPKDVVYCAPEAMREWESGPDGLELIAFGAHKEGDGEVQQGWWAD
jgi:mannose-6-phosphate isomerase-like protein (cupin superfamily)